MKIFLLGYMGSGKSTVGKLLAERLKHRFVDLDQYIEDQEDEKISSLFQKKGEIYFRKKERAALDELLEMEEALIISLGGGTPCYGDNLQVIQNSAENTTVYLKYSIPILLERLWKEKEHRPVISHLDDKEKLEEFIRKHLFERGFYYNQSNLILSCDEQSPEQICAAIQEKLR